ncbi:MULTISPECIES: phospho-N-acetylmuramoyl-pentapeptide-transferase [Roseivirga]|uniref:Phospho-N-acetylmuramoyl-pentapeptide-transferase n=1 Tax=Roseivirga spongicola TaxID=333140 RepID=A0A150X919_9BACT|nr:MULTISPECIES: phospho-N-acetylmuramoyl-pentapeptide-transferase [Roseivirga]PWL27564.1 MAG: phospho-N-acetylmuramoyl-pentapeptide-transferase [Roseivirga sp. XM-24bin3]KYG75174.1 phospho-N-acetylmuramoyl-pentapeptide-transferase [Roseivirga spongicola]MBO6662039.1 phospho-N-acetylmuramoyl-pentapeptide-transferase [Roseivirga sp.]MBO6760625.1 phospho-N-acetylmuramoyl-pentapeptide-transferase [Roseivirga sp.]MBO6909372.1 phospho-N-acetylmuramoyl-pentapeptide-transferase [Roseivirga sp.]
MLYYLFDYLDREFDLIGAGVFQYISFRAGMAVLVSLLITITFGESLITMLRKKQVGETIRDLGLEGQMQKKGTPTMGGLIIIAAIVVPTLLFAKLENIYVILLLVTTLVLGAIGFLDDYIKVFKKNKEGLAGRFKVVGQVAVGLIVGATLFFSEDVVVREFSETPTEIQASGDTVINYEDVKSTTTTIPFVKNNELDYSKLNPTENDLITAAIYILIVIFFVTAISNGANITDGIDGLAAGTSAIIGLTLAILAYISGNAIFSEYLNVMFIPNSGELVIFCTAFVGACVGFLWYNSYPAQVFMGDTGSLSLGGIIAVLALVLRKELLIPVLCGIFVIENLSVILQVSYFKYTKKKYGEGRRIFKMSPLHHHYQKMEIPEPKIVTRFWIVGILLAIIALATLKLR